MHSSPSISSARSAFRAAGVVAVVGVAGWLRFSDLERMPVHADEAATGGQTLAHRLEDSGYAFDPAHFHGPMLTGLAMPWCRIRGETDWESLTIGTMRSMTGTCGMFTIGAVLLLGTGWRQAAAAMGLIATSPLLVYYSRVFIHEPVFVMFAMVAMAGLLWLLRGRRPWLAAAALGAGIGLMAATRETVVISLFAWGLAGMGYLWRGREGRRPGVFLAETGGRLWMPMLLAAALCLGVIFWFYSAGGRNPAGFFGFFATYFEYEVGEGHEKPLDYYLQLLVWPKIVLGRWWMEGGVLLFALCAWWDRKGDESARAGRFFFEAGLLHLLVFSLIGYKTPWLVCLGWLQLCIAGGYGMAALMRRLPERLVWAPVAVMAGVVAWQGAQAARAIGRFAADGRNPYAYVPTSVDVVGLAGWLNELRAALPETREAPLAVVGEQYWPLPWYLRGAGEVGYWEEVPEEGKGWPVLLLMPAVLESASAELRSTHTMIPRGLRDEAPMVVAVRNDVWERYLGR